MTPHPLALLTAVAVLVLSSVAIGGLGGLAAGPARSPDAPGVAPGVPGAALPLTVPALAHAGSTSVPVGLLPVGILMDPTNATAFVESEFGNNLTFVSLKTDTVTAVVSVGDTPYPEAMALDPTNWTVYVANSGSANVSVVSIGGEAVLHSVTVGAVPDAIVLNPYNKELYVANYDSGTVSIISPAGPVPTVIATVPVGSHPDALVVNSATHAVFVADEGSGNVSVISAKTNSVVKTVPVGVEPGTYGSILYDPATKDVYVADAGSSNVSVIGGKNMTDFASVPVGSGPDALVLDSATGDLFVANQYSANVTVVVARNGTIARSIDVGDQPGVQGALAIDPALGLVYVANAASNNVSVVSAATLKVVRSMTVGTEPVVAAVDPIDASVWVANEGSLNVSIFRFGQVTFIETGLPKGDSWSVSVGAPPVSASAVVGRGKSSVSLYVVPGKLSYSVTLPTTFALSKVTGPNGPGQRSIDITGLARATFRLFVGPLESLTFTEKGLPAHSVWAISLHSALATGGPPGQNLSSSSSSMTFPVVKGAWRYTLTTVPNPYFAKSPQGSVSVGTHAVTKTIVFKEVVAEVLFDEAGLPSGAFWQVNVTGPVSESVSSTNATITFELPSGTYTYAVWNFSAYNPQPETGTLSVVAPHNTAYVIAVSYISK